MQQRRLYLALIHLRLINIIISYTGPILSTLLSAALYLNIKPLVIAGLIALIAAILVTMLIHLVIKNNPIWKKSARF